MPTTLSLFFNQDRTYIASVSQGDRGLVLEHIDSTDEGIDLENYQYEDTSERQADLIKRIEPIKNSVDFISVTLPAESVIVTQLPADTNQDPETLRDLLALEIRQSYPHFNREEFVANIIQMSQKKNGVDSVLGVIFTNELIQNCTELLKPLGLDIANIDFSQMNAHSAFLYNYPEHRDKNTMIFSIQDNFIDISVVKEGMPCYYNLLSYSDNSEIPGLVEKQHAHITKQVVEDVTGAYFFGKGLTKDLYLQVRETCMLIGVETARLNAFRMVETNLGEREKEYASRTQHIFPPVIGGSFKPYHKRIKFY
jgi:hypothetical protein